MDHFGAFREIVVADFEFVALDGERPRPVCLVAHELRSGRRHHLFQDQFGPEPPYPSGTDVLFVAFFGSAELGCYRALRWPTPPRVLDLYAEFRARTNGLPLPAGRGLLGALAYFGLSTTSAGTKGEMQQAIGQDRWQGRFNPEEILDYCERDVVATVCLFEAMAPRIDLPRALLRGRYMAAAAAMEWTGVPIDTDTLARLRADWSGLKDRLIIAVDRDYGIFDGPVFKHDRFAAWLAGEGIPWPRLESGRLDLSDETFEQQSKAHPKVAPLRELRASLSELRLEALAVGQDGRNRTLLSPFGARTARNTPSNSRFIFGPAIWLRGLIQPPRGHAVAYIDWGQQEFGIAAALSRDPAMLAAYTSGDPYLEFARQAGAVPQDATKQSHGPQRELYKGCVLGVQFGMGAETLATRINQPPIVARDLLKAHRQTYARFWRWSDAAVDTAMLHGTLHTVFGWPIHTIGAERANPRSLQNFPMQANGAEMMRLACCLATERGIEVAAPIHDALLIVAPLDRLDADVATTRDCMAEASRAVLGGFELGSDASVTRYPNRYMDPRGAVMWQRVMELLRPPAEEVRRHG